jgi:hypothetical protein
LPALASSQPWAGATPPTVETRRIPLAWLKTPEPSLDLMSSSSHGIAPAAGAGAFAFTAPTTLPPLSASQVGPA